jgi:hypothetical protein
MPTLSRPYCTLEQVQAETRNTEAGVEDTMRTAINLASRFIEQHCRADFWEHDHTTTPLPIPAEWIAKGSIYLPWPIVSVSLLEDISGSTAVQISADDYKVRGGLDANGGVMHRGMIYYSGELPTLAYKDTLRATGMFGYTLADTDPDETPPVNVPAAVNRACTLIASTWSAEYRKQWHDSDGMQQEMLQTNVPKEAYSLLSRWRIPQSF